MMGHVRIHLNMDMDDKCSKMETSTEGNINSESSMGEVYTFGKMVPLMKALSKMEKEKGWGFGAQVNKLQTFLLDSIKQIKSKVKVNILGKMVLFTMGIF